MDAYGGELGHDLVGGAVEADVGEARAAGAHELDAGDAADGAEHDLQVGRRHALRQPALVQQHDLSAKKFEMQQSYNSTYEAMMKCRQGN